MYYIIIIIMYRNDNKELQFLDYVIRLYWFYPTPTRAAPVCFALQGPLGRGGRTTREVEDLVRKRFFYSHDRTRLKVRIESSVSHRCTHTTRVSH